MKIQNISNKNISSLYILSRISLVAVLVLGFLILIALYSMQTKYILLWYIVLFLLVLFRIRDSRIFKNSPNKFSLEIWHKRFFVLSLLTATIYSLLGFIFIYGATLSQQYYIIFVLLGLSSASVTALSVDIRLNILYSSILLVPISTIIFFTDTMPLNTVISMTFLLYLLSQVFIINKTYIQKQKIDKLESQEMLLHSLFKNAPLGVFTYNKELEINDCNEELGRIFNNSKDNIIGINLKNLPDSRAIKVFTNPSKSNKNVYEGPYTSMYGQEFWLSVKAFTMEESFWEKLGGIGIIEDKTKEHNALEKLEYLVSHDVLTGLLNRRGLLSTINDIVAHEKHQNHYSILFYMDLNQFKAINDSLGHAIGDKVLLTVSERISGEVNASYIISRLGGDEFVLIVPFVSKDKKETEYEAKNISIAIQSIFSKPFIIEEMHLYMSASMGIVIMDPQYNNTEEILRHADLAMYQAKKTNKYISYYDSSYDAKQKDLFMLQHNLAHAKKNNEFKLFLQPIVKMKNDSLHAAELLLRWNHPTKGLLSPDKFISLTVKAGLLSKITWWLVESICQQIQSWKKEGKWKLNYISINISPNQLLENNFANEFIQKLAKYNIEKSEIILEITERSLIDNFENTQDVISALKENGVKCAIDDFGIGYSSLSYLKRLSLHTLKIDREFVKDIGKDPSELILMNTILNIGRQFNYNIIIEGIENSEQIDALSNMDKELYYQGYLYSKPLDIEEFSQNFLV